MVRNVVVSIVLFATLAAGFYSCGRNGLSPSPVEPDNNIDSNLPSSQANHAGHYIWAYYLVQVDTESGSVDIIPVRQAEGHWNVLKFLEHGPCTTCVSVLNFRTNDSGNREFDVSISHPFTNTSFTGFDVRGIAMFAGSREYPALGLTASDQAFGDGELINADGYTTLFNPSTIDSGPGGLEGYLDGRFSGKIVPDSVLNGYKRHISTDPSNTRNALYAGGTSEATYEIAMPSPQFVFGYAVDASWAPPLTNPVTDPMTDFPPDANSLEPWKISATVSPIGSGLTDNGGSASISLTVHDWQGTSTHLTPVAECPELFESTISAWQVAEYDGSSRWRIEISNDNLASPGTYRCVIKIEDIENASAPPWLDLSAYQVADLRVISDGDAASGWVEAWGGTFDESASATAITPDGTICVLGSYSGSVDFDPSDTVETHTSVSTPWQDIYLTKFTLSGDFLGALTWGGNMMDHGSGIAIDSLGNIYITGQFANTVDFDPGDGIYNVDSTGMLDAFILKLDPQGLFLWAQNIGGAYSDDATSVAVDSSGNSFITGNFQGTCDFDPGIGDDFHTSTGGLDCFIVSFDPDGIFRWAETWGSIDHDTANCVDINGNGLLYAVGQVSAQTDFDPGGETSLGFTRGLTDCFLTKFDTDGNWSYAFTWGGTGYDSAESVALASTGDSWVTGYFENSVDFDPGEGEFNIVSNGKRDVFATWFYPEGSFANAVTWGGWEHDQSAGITVNESLDTLYISGFYQFACDFDTGPSSDLRLSLGNTDAFVNVFDTGLNWRHARTWGGVYDDYASSTVSDTPSGAFFTVGGFMNWVNFHPPGGNIGRQSSGASDSYITSNLSNGTW